jgi:putative heme-binding domain-containing protein
LWWRRTAQRLLMDRRAVSVVPDLLQLIQTGPPLGRLHALWTLEGLGRLDSATIDKALADPEPGLRKNALILAERRPELSGRLLRVAEDASPKVRFQLLATLGSFDTPAAKVARDRLLFTHFEDRWFQMAALSASSEESLRLFRRAIELAGNQTPGGAAFFTQASSAIASRRNAAEIQQVIQTVARGKSGSPQWWAVPSLRGLSAGLGGRRSRPAPLAGREHLLAFLTHPEKEFRRAALQLLGTMGGLPQGSVAVVRKAEAVAEDRSADPELRADALTLLAMAGAAGRESLWKQLISPQEPDPVGVAATRALGSLPGPEIGKFLLANWRTMSTAIRSEACDAMLDDTTRLPMLVSALKDGTVQPWTMNFRQKRRLIMHSDPAIRAEARSVLEQGPGQRQSVLTRYEAALHTNGNAGRGKLVFESACAKCHRFHGSGAPVGPDLATIQNQPKKTLLASILMPNESIAQGYETYVVETASGGRLDGVIGSQTPTTIVLLHEDGKEDVIQRRDIKGMYVTNLSAMPEDLEKQISIEQMSDLLEYLKTTH